MNRSPPKSSGGPKSTTATSMSSSSSLRLRRRTGLSDSPQGRRFFEALDQSLSHSGAVVDEQRTYVVLRRRPRSQAPQRDRQVAAAHSAPAIPMRSAHPRPPHGRRSRALGEVLYPPNDAMRPTVALLGERQRGPHVTKRAFTPDNSIPEGVKLPREAQLPDLARHMLSICPPEPARVWLPPLHGAGQPYCHDAARGRT
jgi:hypothetical protein